MNWLKSLFRKCPKGSHAKSCAAAPIPRRPADWNLTLDDLFAEMEAGKRKSVGNPEVQWARQYERSLIPEGARFPRKGDIYESRSDQTVHYMTAWSMPYTGGGEAVLFKGERIRIDNDPGEEKPISTYAIAVDYTRMEERMISKEEREDARYAGFYLHLKTVDLIENFILIQPGVNAEGESVV